MGKYKQIELQELKRKEDASKLTPLFNVYTSFDKVFPKMIEAIYKETINEITIEKSHKNFAQIVAVFKKLSKEEKQLCYDFLTFLHKKKLHKILEDYNYISGILQLMSLCLFWVRDFNDWNKKSYNSEKQLFSLLRFLLCKYDVPEFMNSAFYDTNRNNRPTFRDNYTGNSQYIDWFLHLGEGKSARELKGLPIPFTKKMAHAFINTPEHYQIEEAIRRAQIIGMGGDEIMTYSILGSMIGCRFENNDFWVTVIQFFINTPMLNPDLIAPIIDFINSQKFRREPVFVDGTFVRNPSPQPNFCMKGRTIDKLIEDTENWHNQLNKIKRNSNLLEWKPVGIKEFEYTEGQPGEKNFKFYTIKEILNSAILQKEGQSMKHCVYSYVNSCYKGQCSIWSMTLSGERLLTIEVRTQIGSIVQVRGKHNARATQKDIMIINRWANYANLKVSPQAF